MGIAPPQIRITALIGRLKPVVYDGMIEVDMEQDYD